MLIPSQNWGEDIAIDSSCVENNLNDIRNNIAHSKVKIIAVTKYYGLKSILAGYEAGLRDFGESRAIDAIQKIEALPLEIKQNSTFHFIGHLQTNKVDKVVKHFDVIQSVDSLKLAEHISASACKIGKRVKILLQINNAGEEQKFGYSKEQLKQEFESLLALEGVDIIGLMNMAPLGASREQLEFLFSDVRKFRDELQTEFNVNLPELSMGMSDDYVVAVNEGATMIRIGRKLFT